MGDLGPSALAFVRQLEAAGQSLWQMLPIHPPGRGFSPYEASSAFAGNPALLSLEPLVRAGWLASQTASARSILRRPRNDRARAKDAALRHAFSRFESASDRQTRRARRRFDEFVDAEREWLDDFALFALLSRVEGTPEWTRWEAGLCHRRVRALRKIRSDWETDLRYEAWLQFLFVEQWQTLRDDASSRGIEFVGDLPIYVSHRSADVWARRELFLLDGGGRPRWRAGVPPDDFSRTGQLWGNPLYDWKRMSRDGFGWWVARIRHELRLFDCLRLDHFIGFHRAWAVGPRSRTAVRGRWMAGPRHTLFRALRDALGGLPFVAEDLGLMIPEVRDLRDTFGLPGMHVLQMGFGSGAENEHLPHNHRHNAWVYTGTHDNQTTVQWWRALRRSRGAHARRIREYILDYLGRTTVEMDEEPHWELVRLAYGSISNTVVIPAQDVLGLGARARMNLPATVRGNWGWRMPKPGLGPREASRLRELAETFGRVAGGEA